MQEDYPVISGAEPFYLHGNKIGILISHGFMGTPQSVRYIGEALWQLGYTIMAPRLKGHGTHYKDLEKCDYQDWFETLENSYQELKRQCTSIFVLGQSMGGTLALWLAHKYREIKGIVLVNAALTVPAYEHLKEKTLPRFINEGNPDIKAENAYEITYEKAPIHAIHQLQKLMDITPAILPQIHCPVLGYKSTEDHVVPPENTDFIIEHIGSARKEIKVLENSFHVASLDQDKDKVVHGAQCFVQQQVNHWVV